MVSVSVCKAGRPGSSPARSVCYRKVEIYQHVIKLSPPVLTTGLTKVVHVLPCLCDNASKRSLAMCRKRRAPCLVSRLLSVPIQPACAEQGRQYDSNQIKNQKYPILLLKVNAVPVHLKVNIYLVCHSLRPRSTIEYMM